MSEHDRWSGRGPYPRRRRPDELNEPDDPSASVFGSRARPGYPDPQPYPPSPPPAGPPPADPTLQYPVAPYPGDPRAPWPPGPDDPYWSPERDPRQARRPGERDPERTARRAPSGASRGGDTERGRGAPSREPRGRGFPLGVGTLFGVVGLGCFLAALLVLPWFVAGGEDVTLADIRDAFTIPETQPDDLLPDTGDAGDQEPPASTGPVPSPEAVTDAVEDAARDAAAQAAANAIDTGKTRYLELYVERLWVVAAVGVSLAVLFSTILAPRSAALSLLLGFRRLGGVVTVLAGVAHGIALWIVFTGAGAPDPAFGVWLGGAGLLAVLVGCILGPKR